MRAIAALLLAGLLAGCTASDDGGEPDVTPTPTTPTASDYSITLSEFPVAPLEAGEQFRFNSTVSGEPTRASDHIGAHFGNRTTSEPTTSVYDVACAHTGGTLPGRFQVTCTAPQEPGVYYLRGHARITTGTAQVNWWSNETTFTVAPLQGNLQA